MYTKIPARKAGTETNRHTGKQGLNISNGVSFIISGSIRSPNVINSNYEREQISVTKLRTCPSSATETLVALIYELLRLILWT